MARKKKETVDAAETVATLEETSKETVKPEEVPQAKDISRIEQNPNNPKPGEEPAPSPENE